MSKIDEPQHKSTAVLNMATTRYGDDCWFDVDSDISAHVMVHSAEGEWKGGEVGGGRGAANSRQASPLVDALRVDVGVRGVVRVAGLCDDAVRVIHELVEEVAGPIAAARVRGIAWAKKIVQTATADVLMARSAIVR